MLAVAPGGAAGESGFVLSALSEGSSVSGNSVSIWRLAPDGGRAARLTDTPLADWMPTVAGDETVYFVRNKSYGLGVPVSLLYGQWDLWRMNGDGTGQEPVTKTPHLGEWAPAVSPDGRFVAYENWNQATDEVWIEVLDVAAGETTVIPAPPGGWAGGPSFPADAGRLIYQQFYGDTGSLMSAAPDGSGPRVITGFPRRAWDPEVSPDDTRVAYTLGVGNFEFIEVLDLRTGRTRRLTSENAFHYAPTWSPDGTQLLYTHATRDEAQLVVMAADGTQKQALTAFTGWPLEADWFGPRPAVFPPPPSDAAPVPAPAAPDPTPAPAAEPPLRLRTRAARPDRSGRVALRVVCAAPAGCRGRLVLVRDRQGPPRALAAARVSLRPGARATLRLRIARTTLRWLRSRRALPARVDFVTPGGSHVSGRLILQRASVR